MSRATWLECLRKILSPLLREIFATSDKESEPADVELGKEKGTGKSVMMVYGTIFIRKKSKFEYRWFITAEIPLKNSGMKLVFIPCRGVVGCFDYFSMFYLLWSLSGNTGRNI